MSLLSFALRIVALVLAWGFLREHGLCVAALLLVLVVPVAEDIPIDLIKGGW